MTSGLLEEAVEVVQEEQGRAVGLGQRRQGTQGGQRDRRRRPGVAALSLPGRRRPLATSQTATFHCLARASWTISRSASSGSKPWIHRPEKAAWTYSRTC